MLQASKNAINTCPLASRFFKKSSTSFLIIAAKIMHLYMLV